MNEHYIAGFFDADGYVTISKNSQKDEKTPTVGFTNNVIELLEQIRKFIFDRTGFQGKIVSKLAKKETHQISYDLKYQGFNASLAVLDLLPIQHPKKLRRTVILKEIKLLTPRNGKYTPSMLEERRSKCDEFLSVR